MDSLTKNPFLLWLVISIAVGALVWTFLRKELRTKAILYGSFLIACLVSLWPVQEQDQARTRPQGRDAPDHEGGHRRCAPGHDFGRGVPGLERTGPGRHARSQGHGNRHRLIHGGEHRTGAGEGRAHHPSRLLPLHRMESQRDRLRLLGQDDRPLQARAQGADGPGVHPHPGTSGERSGGGRTGHHRPWKRGGPDPRPAPGRHRRGASQGHDQAHGPALAEAR